MPLLFGLMAAGALMFFGGAVLRRGAPAAVAGDGGVLADAPSPPTELPSHASRPARRMSAERRSDLLAWLGYTTLYVLVGAYIVLGRHIVAGDAAARVAEAWYVIASRDPHLAAIGFVWNPLPSLLEIPLVALRGLWPALTQYMFAGTIVSAVFMAGAVVHLRACLREMHASNAVSIMLTAGMALSPMVILYGANGMSEAMYLCFLLGAVRYLMRWTVSGHIRALVWTACYLALAVLTRYEAVAAIAAVIVVVFIVGTTARDPDRPVRERALGGLSDALVVALPPLTAFVAWCVVSWVIVGDAFVQFNSRYGNASILQASSGGASSGTFVHQLVLVLEQTFAYAPVGLAIGIVGVAVAWMRRDRRYLALVALAAPLVFSIGAYVRGGTFGLFRYYIPALPLALLTVALLLHPRRGMRPSLPSWRAGKHRRARRGVRRGVVELHGHHRGDGGCACLAPTDQPVVNALFHSGGASTANDTGLRDSGAEIAHAIDKYGLASGSVAMDTFDCGFMVVLNSVNPHQFVITSDRDFERIAADPIAFHVPYVLVPNADSGIDAISVAHPGIYNGGTVDGLHTQIVTTFHTPACPDYRLIRILSDSSGA